MKVVLEIDENLKDGDILVYQNKKFVSIHIHDLLPELKNIKENSKKIDELVEKIDELIVKVKELRGED